MPTDNTSSTGTEGTETGQQEQQEQQATTSETEGQGEQQQTGTTQEQEPIKLPDDHPLVKTLATQKTALATQKTELAEARAKAAKATKLEEELNARPTQEALDTLQTRYERLEGFLQAAGGPLGKALDSRTFTRELFETDKDIAEIVKEWNKANPSATSQALGSSAAEPGKGKQDPNQLLRIAAGKQ